MQENATNSRIKFRNKVFVTLVIIAFLSNFIAYAEDEISLYYAHYQDDDNLTVFTPVFRISKDWFDRSTFYFRYGFERFDKEAPDVAPGAVDAISGATTVSGGSGSGFTEDRHETSFSGLHKFDQTSLSWAVSSSDETDFNSTGISIGIAKDFNQKNFNLGVTYSLNNDEIITNQITDESETKQAHSLTLSATQLLNRYSFVSSGINYSYSSGYHSNPLRKVVVERPLSRDVYNESHPDSRSRYTVFTKIKHYFETRTAIELKGSIYTDDWGINSYNYETRLYQYITGNWFFRLRYLQHAQGKADFYKSLYTSRESIMTADNRLRKHNINLIGARLAYVSNLSQKSWEIALGLDHYKESNNGLSANIIKLSSKFEY